MKILMRVLLFLSVTAGGAYAQQTGLSGVVTDVQGAVIAGAKVQVKEQDGSSFYAITNGQGAYIFPALVAAEYKITVTAQGFSTAERRLLVLVGQLSQVNLSLQIASATAAVEVNSGDVLAIDTTSSIVAGNVTPNEVQDVPINGRNYIQLSTLIPGIKANAFGNTPVSGPGGTSQGDAETGKFQITMDGLQVSQDSVGSSFGQPRFSQDAISQFQIITNRFDATSGRSAGVYVNGQTKSGGDVMHGGGFGYFRNSFFNASDPVLKRNGAAVTRPLFADEQYGGTMGGSIRKGKLWYFASYEGEHSPQTATLTPVVTSTGASFSHPNVLLLNEYLGRIDYQANSKNHFFLRGDKYSQKQSFVPTTAIGTDPSQSNINTVDASGYVFDWNRNINDHLINDIHAGFHYFQFETTPYFTTGSIVLNLPLATIGEPYNEPEIFDQYTQQYRDDLFWLKGKHSFKFGAEYLYTLHGGTFPQYLRGGLTSCTPVAGAATPNYNTFFPNGTLDPASWRYDLINSYCGGGETYIQAFGDYSISIARNAIGVWAQDDWKILPRLTLNLGIRYDNDIGAYNTSFVPTPGLLTPNSNPNANFAPRLGFSYDPFGDGKTSIRGGAGLYFADQVANAIIDEQLYSSTTRALQATVSGTNLLSSASPFAGQNPSANPGNYSSSPQPVARGSKTPYSLQASFGIQREVGYRTTMSADLVHQRVYDDFTLLGANLLQNPANAQQNLNPSAAISAANYATRVCGNGIITLDTVSNLATGAPNGTSPTGTPLTKPAFQVCNQAFGGTTREFTTYPGAGVIADALQVSIKHATTKGFNGGIAYTWGRVKNSTNGQFSYPNKPFKPGIQQEWANGTDDQRHTLTVNGQYQWKYGLSLSGLYHYGSGLAYSTSSGTTVNGYIGSTRTFGAGVTPVAFPTSGPCPTGSVCVAAPLSKIFFDSGYGYSIIQRDGFRGSDYNRVDMRLQENLKIKERYHAIVAIEAFNLFNHSNFGNFGTSAVQGPFLASGAVNLNAYGRPASVTGNPVEYQARSLQFIGRFSF